MGLGAAFRTRYLDVLASIYLYNEFRGYTSLDRVLEALRERCPDEPEFQAEIAKHRADERKHYVMFRPCRWWSIAALATLTGSSSGCFAAPSKSSTRTGL